MKVSHKLILTFWLCLAKQIFTRVIKYNVATALCSIMMQNIRCFTGVQSCLLPLVPKYKYCK